MIRKQVVYAYQKNLSMAATFKRKHSVYVGLRHACMNTSAGLRHAYASLSLLSCRVVKKACQILVTDPATVYCEQRYDLKAKLPGGGTFWKKTGKVMLKIYFGKGKYGP